MQKKRTVCNLLLLEAIPIIAEDREVLFKSFELNGKIDDVDVRAELRKIDRWLKKARAATA